MKHNKIFWFAVLPALTISFLAGCSNNTPYEPDEEEEEEYEIIRYEVGDTVIEWKNNEDSPIPVLDVESGGTSKVVDDFGLDDTSSIEYNVRSEYISSADLEEPYFTDDHAKNGDIISLYFYLPSDHNIASVQVEAVPYNGNSDDKLKGDKITINEEKEEKWIRTKLSYDTLDTLGAIRFNIARKDISKDAHFYIDDINITYGEETIENGYEYEDESLCEAFKDYFIVGNIMSDSYVHNTKMRQIIQDNFCSITAENEAKPQSVLDQAACQELAKVDETEVAITTKPFEAIYDWAEAHHMKVRHHTFVWHQQTPNWFFNEGYSNNGKQVSRDVMLGRLHNYLKTTIETLDERWPGLVYALDIVNEAIEEVDKIRSGSWRSIVGDDFIYQAFLAANEYKMDYQDLYYNDYAFDQMKWGGIERCQWACDTLLKQAIDEGLIDGIGIQAHIEEPAYADAVIEDCKIVCNAGIKCQITELDINCNGKSEFEDQKALYKKIVKSVLEGNADGTMNVNAIIVWGITDNTSWHRQNTPLMFDDNYAKKPAYYGFMEALDEFEG